MPYSYITLGQATGLLANRLYDSGAQFYGGAELRYYVRQALQTFNALANFYRQEFVFPTAANVTWYDLSTVVNTTRPFTVTDTDLVNLIEYHLLEPQTTAYPLTWAGSRQFSLNDILAAIQQVRDQLLSDSLCTLSESLVNASPGRTFLADDTLEIRRVAWIPVTGFGYTPNVLTPSDIWADQSFNVAFPQSVPGYPLSYRRSTEPPLSFDVDVQPAIPGNYDVLTVNAGTALTNQAATTMIVPDDWCWVIVWGALAQLLNRDSSARDPFRADYCQLRYKQGVAAMKQAPALLAARINDVPVTVESITNGDNYRANWQSLTPTQPDSIYYAGLNMVATAPIPSGIASITASVVSNMVLPVNTSDFLQIGRDSLGPVLGYAQHLALWKCGGAEFAATAPLYKDFITHCTLFNSKLSAQSLWLEMIDGRGQEDERVHPSYQAPIGALRA